MTPAGCTLGDDALRTADAADFGGFLSRVVFNPIAVLSALPSTEIDTEVSPAASKLKARCKVTHVNIISLSLNWLSK
jgi:hypothetical protein